LLELRLVFGFLAVLLPPEKLDPLQDANGTSNVNAMASAVKNETLRLKVIRRETQFVNGCFAEKLSGF